MTYLSEIGGKWRYVLAASIGQGAGYGLVTYFSNLFTPHLLKEFGWSRSDFALIGMTFLFGILIQPITGRLGDAFGVRRVAIVGIIGGPLVYVGLSMMTGGLWQYFALILLQLILTSGATSIVIYSRLIAKNLNRARGIALAIAASTPAVAAAILVPTLARYIDANGWRMGYRIVALCSFLGGMISWLLIPAATDLPQRVPHTDSRSAPRYGAIMRSRPFQLLVAAVFLCLLSFSLQTTQLKVLLLDHGVESSQATWCISLFAMSTIIGRLLSGLSLDRLPPHAVAAVFLGLPGVGLGLFAFGVTQPLPIAIAVAFLGLSMGAEGDVWAYLVAKYFKPDIYGTVLGMVLSAMALSTGLGALLLSLMLKLNHGFTPFLIVTAISVFAGSCLLLLLRSEPAA